MPKRLRLSLKAKRKQEQILLRCLCFDLFLMQTRKNSFREKTREAQEKQRLGLSKRIALGKPPFYCRKAWENIKEKIL